MTLIPQDGMAYVTEWLTDYLIPLLPSLSGFKVGGTYLEPGVTPDKYIRITVSGNADYQRVGGKTSLS